MVYRYDVVGEDQSVSNIFVNKFRHHVLAFISNILLIQAVRGILSQSKVLDI